MSKGVKNLTFYIAMLVVFSVLMYFVVKMGTQLETTFQTELHIEKNDKGALVEGFGMFLHAVEHHAQASITMLLLQIIAILFVARIFGWLFSKMGQPSVIGEIVAGIILGPSLFAQVAPETFNFLFSPESLGNIDMLSQIGLILFMFAIGMELDISEVRKNLKETLVISHAGIVFPFLLGMLGAYWTYSEYASEITPFLSYSLFIGIAMSITAFPVLARIIQEKGLSKSRVGTISIASAANGDVTAWCILAVVIAIAQSGTLSGALYVILFTALFVLFMFYVMRPFFNIIGNLYHNKEVMNKTIVAFMFFFLIAFSYTTEMLGIHALFGAFITGVVMPNNVKFRKILTEKVEDVALCLFLPLFFVSTGLKTQIGLISTPSEWMVCLLFIVIAIVGKLFGTALAARFTGECAYNSWTIGALMNTRGLMELVVLAIGYEMKILPPTIFVMLVLMTLVTTFITSPLMTFIDFCFKKKQISLFVKKKQNLHPRVLISFGRASSGSILLNVANQLFSAGKHEPEFTALHITVGTEVNPIHVDNIEEVSFEPIVHEAEKLGVKITPRYEISHDAGQEIVDIVNKENYDLLLVGAGLSLSDIPTDIEAMKHTGSFLRRMAPKSWFYPGDFLKDKTKTFIKQTNSTVGVFINRDFDIADKVLVILDQPEDIFLFEYATNLIRYNQAQITILNLNREMVKNSRALKKIERMKQKYANVTILQGNNITSDILINHNFMMVGYETWNRISVEQKEELQYMPSTLVVNFLFPG